MAGFVQFDIKKMFFDTKVVASRLDIATRKALSKFGAFVRRTARSSIRKRRKASKPGQPPSSHTGLLKRGIVFGYDPIQESVVVGPTPLRGKATVPRLLEEGGVVSRRKEKKIVMYQARPYMGPAFHKELPKLDDMWKDAL